MKHKHHKYKRYNKCPICGAQLHGNFYKIITWDPYKNRTKVTVVCRKCIIPEYEI